MLLIHTNLRFVWSTADFIKIIKVSKFSIGLYCSWHRYGHWRKFLGYFHQV